MLNEYARKPWPPARYGSQVAQLHLTREDAEALLKDFIIMGKIIKKTHTMIRPDGARIDVSQEALDALGDIPDFLKREKPKKQDLGKPAKPSKTKKPEKSSKGKERKKKTLKRNRL